MTSVTTARRDTQASTAKAGVAAQSSGPAPVADPIPARLGIVPALDLDTVDELKRVVEATCTVPGVVEYKLGLSAVLHVGLFDAVRAIRNISDLPILYDHQKAGPDMPASAKPFVKICSEAGLKGLILFPVAGPTAVRQFVGHSLEAGLIPVVGGEIPVPDYCIKGGGYFADDGLDRIIEQATKMGGRHFVLPANDLEMIRRRSAWLVENIRTPVLFLTGIGPLGGTIAEAFGAAEGLPSRLAVIGRKICAAPDPGEAARRMVDEVMQFS